MAISILMDSNHDLIITSQSTLRQRDIGESIEFIIPIDLEFTLTTDCIVTLKILTIGNELYEYTLTPEEEIYKDSYYKYPFQMKSAITSIAGDLTLYLNIKKMSDSLVENQISSSELRFHIDSVSPEFGAVKTDSETADSKVVDLVVSGDSLILVNSYGEQVGTGVKISSDAADVSSDGIADGWIVVGDDTSGGTT